MVVAVSTDVKQELIPEPTDYERARWREALEFVNARRAEQTAREEKFRAGFETDPSGWRARSEIFGYGNMWGLAGFPVDLVKTMPWIEGPDGEQYMAEEDIWVWLKDGKASLFRWTNDTYQMWEDYNYVLARSRRYVQQCRELGVDPGDAPDDDGWWPW